MNCLVLNSKHLAKESKARSKHFVKEQDIGQRKTETERGKV